MLSVGTASAAPGETAVGELDVGDHRDGTPVTLPVAVINGATSGERLYLQAASDGDEVNGVGVLNRVLPTIDPTALSGEIVAVGVVNPFGFHAGKHRNPLDDTKINRTYPGDEDGSSSERIAAATFTIAKEADYILDLHQGSTSRMIEECRVRCGQGHTLHGACLELAKVFDCGYILDQKGPDGQLARAGPDAGIPTIDPELGGSVGWSNSSIEIGVRGVERVLGYYGFLEGPTVSLSTQVRARSFEQYGAPDGGLVSLVATLGDRVTVGDPLFRVTTIFGTERAVVTAEEDGVLWRARRLPQVATGEYVCTVGTNVGEY